MLWRKAVFIVLVIYCLSPLGSAPAALILGCAMGLTIGPVFPALSGRPTRLLFETSIVLLGFGTDLTTVYNGLKGGVLFAIAGAAVLVVLAYVWNRIKDPEAPHAPPISKLSSWEFDGPDDQWPGLSLPLLLICILSVFAYPYVAHLVGLRAEQAGIWSALAVPGIASATGLSSNFGHDAMNAALPLLLMRTVLLFFAGLFLDRKAGDGRVRFPWFVLLFLVITVFRTYAPLSIFPSVFDSFVNLADAGLVVSLFLIGASVTQPRPMPFSIRLGAIIYWAAVSGAALWAVLHLL